MIMLMYEDSGKWIHGWMFVLTLRLSPEDYEPARNCHVSDTFIVYFGKSSYKKSNLAAKKPWDFVTSR